MQMYLHNVSFLRELTSAHRQQLDSNICTCFVQMKLVVLILINVLKFVRVREATVTLLCPNWYLKSCPQVSLWTLFQFNGFDLVFFQTPVSHTFNQESCSFVTKSPGHRTIKKLFYEFLMITQISNIVTRPLSIIDIQN